MTFGQEMERVNSYNPGACTGQTDHGCKAERSCHTAESEQRQTARFEPNLLLVVFGGGGGSSSSSSNEAMFTHSYSKNSPTHSKGEYNLLKC